ncbi:T9SS type A sorting domain-containing protein [Vicingus serpentipes]|uniref:T9SS type A sorting domain-containing protein n=1 Tax=Vicingus serpentipes TaxID=1926625 RepID=A0A5C6RSY8_9FLAO|nr:T9SS type A sorting domain-containing protein [Vicingus serpentipes]TXB65373.1 T9SS type A sorting domain-containing protein [Vicingus serpentipes]
MERKIIRNTQEILVIILLFGLMFIASEMFAQHQVGHTQITFQDASRGNRAIQTEIYYPASTSGDDVSIVAGQYPVIVFGHGFVMAWSAYENLWQSYVPRGYIMMFPRTEGSLTGTDHQQFGWDLQFLVTEMQNEGATPGSIFFNGVAPETALMGHSMGGGASFLAADSLVANGNINLKTLVGYAPAESSTNGVSSINSALNITVPSVVFSGSNDGVTPAADHHTPMYDNLASNCKTFINVLGGGHCYFANTNTNCDFGESTSSTGISITREEQQDIAQDLTNLWLDYMLKGDCDAFDYFQDSLANSTRISHLQECAVNPTPIIADNSGDLTSSTTGVSYQWYLDGNPIPASNSQTITATQDGDYTVEVTYANSCPETSAPYTVTTTSLAEYALKDFTIYPNPTKGLITIKGVGLKNVEVQLYNLVGKLITNFSVDNNETINLSNLPEGVYLLKVNGTTNRIILSK